jgi:hypothetical protein
MPMQVTGPRPQSQPTWSMGARDDARHHRQRPEDLHLVRLEAGDLRAELDRLVSPLGGRLERAAPGFLQALDERGVHALDHFRVGDFLPEALDLGDGRGQVFAELGVRLDLRGVVAGQPAFERALDGVQLPLISSTVP